MPPKQTASGFIETLARHNRVILLGGAAVIAHGLNRTTKDIDVWLEPGDSPEAWVASFLTEVERIEGAALWSLARSAVLPSSDATDEIVKFGVVRVIGLDRDTDLFRNPNELEPGDFDEIWGRAAPLRDGTRLMDEIDLYVTKANTGRNHDRQDQLFLESLIKEDLAKRLPSCGLDEARSLLARFLDPEVLRFALDNPNEAVRRLAIKYLQEFETEGDPYSHDILREWHAKPPK